MHTFRDFHGPVVESLALPPGVVRDREVVPWAHNLYLEILAERGLVGAMAFAAILTAMGVMLRRSMQESAGPSRLVAQGLSASLATFLVLALFDLTFLKDWVLLLFWLLAALVARLPVLSAADHPIGGRSTG